MSMMPSCQVGFNYMTLASGSFPVVEIINRLLSSIMDGCLMIIVRCLQLVLRHIVIF